MHVMMMNKKLTTRCHAAQIHPSNFTNRLDQIEQEELAKLREGERNAS